MTDAAKADRKQRGRPFQKGQSGNPNGRPQGSRSSIALRVDELLAEEAEEVVRAVLQGAKGGDSTAMRLVLERIAPARKSRPISLELPSINDLAGVSEASDIIIAAVGDGTITPDEGQTLSAIVEGRRRVIESEDLSRRLDELEARLGVNRS